MKSSLQSLWDCIIHEENTSSWSAREREGKVSHQTASVMLNTDAEHICQITGLKIDTFTTDRQLHTLQRRTTKQTHFKQTDDMECCITVTLRGSDAREFTSRQSSETTESCAKLRRNDRHRWMHPTRTGGGSGLKLKREIFWCLKPGGWKKLHQLQLPSNQEKSLCFKF